MGRTVDIALPVGAANGRASKARSRANGRGRILGSSRRRETDPNNASLDTGSYAERRVLPRDALYRRVLAFGDVAAAAFALIFGTLAFTGSLPQPLLIAALPLVVVASKVGGLYEHDEYLLRRTTLEEVPSLFQAATAYTLVVLLGGELLVRTDPSRASVVGIWLLLFLSLVVTRAGLRFLLSRFGGVERCLVLGDAAAAARLRRSFDLTGSVRAEVVGRLPLEHRDNGSNGAPALASVAEVLEQEHIDRVVIASRRGDSELMNDAVRLVKGLGVKVSVLPGLFEAVGSSAVVDEVDGLLLLGLRRQGLTRSSRAMKRATDLILASCALLVLSPLVAGAAVFAAVSPGPTLMRQSRRGRDGEAFDLLGFRVDGPHAARFRRFHMHALPHLVNVLKGDISLVGPQPEPLVAVAAPMDQDERAHLRPGLTGLWRLRGAGHPPEELPTLDYLYVANWSLWMDARVLLRTVAYLRRPKRPPAPVVQRAGSRRAAVRLRALRRGHEPAADEIERVVVVEAQNGTPAKVVPLDRTPARRTIPVRPLRVSAVVPATNHPPTLDQCLAAIRGARDAPDEIVVVEDANLKGGPSAARNEGSRRASGDVLVFVDADVVVHPDAFSRIRELFQRDLELTAVFGSYDDGLPTNGRIATFRNVLHHHVHHQAPGVAATFWSGLGAVRRSEFLAVGGFDPERFPNASVEDIDLGMRLNEGGARILLNPRIQGTHLKNWHLREMVLTDFNRRAVPWVGLLMQARGSARSTLNLSWRHRASAGLSLVGFGALLLRRPGMLAASVVSMMGLNGSFYVLLVRRHGIRTVVAGMALHVLHHLVSIAGVPVGLYVAARTVRRHAAR